ncbi:alcohol dehydrogenase catalytic domain-containing protein [Duganella sp. BJB1802]|nr:alcohol dehydrogenase catalytic domain-containing protein [Duganella sp. BJB1802]
MLAMLLERPGQALRAAQIAIPTPTPQQLLLRVAACGVCRTDLHIADGELVPRALAAVRAGGSVVCAGIHMSEVPAFPYALLWGERTLRSVANLTRADGEAFFQLADQYLLQTHTTAFPLAQANAALAALRAGDLDGAAVLVP